MKQILALLFVINTAFPVSKLHAQQTSKDKDNFISYTVDLKKQDLKLYWKNEQGETIRSLQNLKTHVESGKKKLLFAMNAGMYKTDNSPLGLYIENKKQLSPLNTAKGSGNFYMMPNGIFYITADNKAYVTTTANFTNKHNILYATQSGPMLVVNGNIHPEFKKGSTHLNIRNGVGILPNQQIILVMSKTEVSLYDFAEYFKNLGCKNALYLDGFVSRTYYPAENCNQLDGNFGVMIGVTGK